MDKEKEEMKKNVDSKDTSIKISFDDGDQLVQEVKKKKQVGKKRKASDVSNENSQEAE